jgi:hypothetical protein
MSHNLMGLHGFLQTQLYINLFTRQKYVISFTPVPAYSRGMCPDEYFTEDKQVTEPIRMQRRKEKPLASAGNQTRNVTTGCCILLARVTSKFDIMWTGLCVQYFRAAELFQEWDSYLLYAEMLLLLSNVIPGEHLQTAFVSSIVRHFQSLCGLQYDFRENRIKSH